ncbi:hypothetical protein E3E36_10430 [Thermococcus sp. M36]|uniref:hypothetical protein n=1 Tax=Thermococcus sp. M36 TaxID=1638261 RepID=UPI00143C0FF7|nr:hypothetical protein [Thermococcus sp. M36]NJE06543.1 hypothetical protein [Thermococcus sp. M36]
MTEVVGNYGGESAGDVVEEYEVPIRGFLFREGKLEGVYVEGGMLTVTEELPRDVHEDILRGRAGRRLMVREVRYRGMNVLEVYIQDGYRAWPIHVAEFLEED